MRNCFRFDFSRVSLFSKCGKLQSFSYEFKSYDSCSKFRNCFPQLKAIEFRQTKQKRTRPGSYFDIPVVPLGLYDFLMEHSDLQELAIFSTDIIGRMISEFIVNEMKYLEKIRIEVNRKCTSACFEQSRMEHIKKLTLNSRIGWMENWNEEQNDKNYPIFLKELVSIESIEFLEMTDVFVDNRVIEAIGRFKNQRELKLRFCVLYNLKKSASFLRLEPLAALTQLNVLDTNGPWVISNSELISLVEQLKNLRSLSLFSTKLVLLNETYEKIIDIVHKRRQSLAISFEDKRIDSF